MTTRDVDMGQYSVPAGSTVFYNLAEIAMDPESFPEPDQFDPERHLDPNDRSFIPHPRVQPFGIGKMRCLGETMAKAELYMFFAGIISSFELEPGLGTHPETLSTNRAEGLVVGPEQKFRVCFKSTN